ncbi:MAG: VOC family protein [Gammaproteobacteria bacterium]|nr:VOC family protein [Gammaproteobacteria bacterium]
MPEPPDIRLDHINLPARRPAWLADWYAQTFGFKSEGGFVFGTGTLIVFEDGEPLDYGDNAHFGFRCASRDKVIDWAERLGANVEEASSYCGFKASDPEGNHFEVYWEEGQ